MAKGRDYAENLVGPLDRSFYTTQRDVAEKSVQTNWEDLQNQYKNLQDKLKREQAEANRAFANGLVTVAEGSGDRMYNATDNLARSGLTTSGMKDLLVQGDTTAKGEEVLDLLGKSGDINVALAESLSEANKTATTKQNELASQLADILGGIGSADTSAQMSYNKGLANIAEDMEEREAENDLAAAQRAASAAASGYNTDKEEDAYNEALKRKQIMDILYSNEFTEQQKQTMLGALYGFDKVRSNLAYRYTNDKIGDTGYYAETYLNDPDRLKNILYGDLPSWAEAYYIVNKK